MNKLIRMFTTLVVGTLTVLGVIGIIYLYIQTDAVRLTIGIATFLLLCYVVGLCVTHAWKESDMRKRIKRNKRK